MLLNILKSIATENDFRKIPSLLTTLQDVVGGDIQNWFEKNDLNSVWNDMTVLERTTQLQNYINHSLSTGLVKELVEKPEELNTYDVDILVLEWNKYHVSLKANTLEMATRIAQAHGPFKHEDTSMAYTSELTEAAVRDYNEGDDIDYIVDDAQLRNNI